MIFWMNSNRYAGASAVEIVRGLERDAIEYSQKGGLVRDFIAWSLLRLDDRLPLRELAVTDKVSDETLALSFLVLLDQYGLGELDNLPLAVEQQETGRTS
jgi:hypothetical protein